MPNNDVKESNRQLKSKRRKAADVKATQKRITEEDNYCMEIQWIDEDKSFHCDLEDQNEVESDYRISNKRSASSNEKLRETWALANH